MNMVIAPTELVWLKQFFSGRNVLTWQSIETGEAPVKYLDQVMPWLRNLGGETMSHPIVLPFHGENGPIAWYAMASEDRQFFQLIDEIRGFIGPSFSDFDGEWDDLSCDDISEMALKDRFGYRVVKFAAKSPQDREEIGKALILYQALLARRPEIPDRTQRPFGKIRGDFDRALLAGNASHALELLEELCASARVNAEQRKCLEIRLLAGLGHREELARNQVLISSVMDLSLPPQTLVDLIGALYETYIRPIETDSDTTAIRKIFKQQIARPFQSLFRERKGIVLPEVLLSFLLFEAVQDEPNITRCQATLAAFPVDGECRRLAQTWLSAIVPSETKNSTLDSLNIVRQAMFDEDYLVAVEICYQELPSPWVYTALLRCAVELRSLDLTHRVLETFEEIEKTGRIPLTAKDKERIELLRGTMISVPKPFDSNWLVWAKWVSLGEHQVPPVSVLEKATLRWSVNEYVNDAKQCEDLAQIIGNSSGIQGEVFRSSFPYLVEFFADRPTMPTRAFAPIYAMLIKVIAWSETVSADELEIATLLTQALFSIGFTHDTYSECLLDLGEILKSNSSIVNLDWALNTSELLAIYPSQDSELRLRFFMSVIDMARSGCHRVTTTQRNVLNLLAKDYKCQYLLDSFPALESDDEVEEDRIVFDGVIGIYTLTEGAGLRAKQLLGKMFPKARVEINGDGVATDRLISLARNADRFVFAWKSSKHQAFYCIKEARRGQDIIMPSGKATASIVKSVLESFVKH